MSEKNLQIYWPYIMSNEDLLKKSQSRNGVKKMLRRWLWIGHAQTLCHRMTKFGIITQCCRTFCGSVMPHPKGRCPVLLSFWYRLIML